MPDAQLIYDWDDQPVLIAAGVSKGDIWQMSDGQAGFITDAPHNTGERPHFKRSGIATVTKTNGVKILKGGRVYWDYSANSATYKPVNDRDFYIGTAVDDAESGDLFFQVNLNAQQANIIELNREAFDTVLSGTQAVGGFGEWKERGGARKCNITATSEAQKSDKLSQFAFDKGANAIVELIFNVVSDGSGTVVDVNMGLANATHATDADSITEHCFIHLDANNVNINAQSKDGTVTVASTDTTIDYTEGTPVEVWFDTRDPADVQIYINGVLVLGSTVFDLSHATGPFKLLLHVEKSSSTDTYELDVNRFCARLAEQ